MNIHEAWVKRVEELIRVLEGSTIGELELTEAGTEIIIRRRPGMLISLSMPQTQTGAGQLATASPSAATPGRLAKHDTSLPIVAPIGGVYYSAPSPTSPPFVAVGDLVQVGQVIALVEAMKVFNEIQAELAGRVTAVMSTTGNVVQKGDVLIRVEAT